MNASLAKESRQKDAKERSMSRATRTIFAGTAVAILLLSLPGAITAVGDSAYKMPTSNPSFSMGSIVSGNYTNVQAADDTYMRLREGTFFFFFRYLESNWEEWQAFSEASREKVLDIRVEMEARQSDSGESWRAQFYDHDASAWDATWYNLGKFPTAGDGSLSAAVGDAARARRFVSATGTIRVRLASNWDLTRTDLYIDLFRARVIYDSTPPSSSVSSPANGELTAAHSYLVTGAAYDPVPDASGVSAVEVSLDGGTSWVPAAPGAPGDFSTWSYAWNPIPAEGTYIIRSRARDAVGNVESPGPGAALVVDWTPPAVTGTSPANGANPVAVTASLSAVVYDANGVDPASVNGSTFTLVDDEGMPVTGNVSYDPGTLTATFDPVDDLSYGTTYTATLTTGMADLAGNHLAENHAWSFTTAPQPPEYIYADDPGWSTQGYWYVEPYSQLPEPLTGEADLLVANDGGAAASYVIPAGYTRGQLASAKYWQCGVAEVYLDGELVETADLNSDEYVWGVPIYTTLDLEPSTAHIITLRATGTGGPGLVEIDGVPYDLTWMHFVNVQWLRYW